MDMWKSLSSERSLFNARPYHDNPSSTSSSKMEQHHQRYTADQERERELLLLRRGERELPALTLHRPALVSIGMDYKSTSLPPLEKPTLPSFSSLEAPRPDLPPLNRHFTFPSSSSVSNHSGSSISRPHSPSSLSPIHSPLYSPPAESPRSTSSASNHTRPTLPLPPSYSSTKRSTSTGPVIPGGRILTPLFTTTPSLNYSSGSSSSSSSRPPSAGPRTISPLGYPPSLGSGRPRLDRERLSDSRHSSSSEPEELRRASSETRSGGGNHVLDNIRGDNVDYIKSKTLASKKRKQDQTSISGFDYKPLIVVATSGEHATHTSKKPNNHIKNSLHLATSGSSSTPTSPASNNTEMLATRPTPQQDFDIPIFNANRPAASGGSGFVEENNGNNNETQQRPSSSRAQTMSHLGPAGGSTQETGEDNRRASTTSMVSGHSLAGGSATAGGGNNTAFSVDSDKLQIQQQQQSSGRHGSQNASPSSGSAVAMPWSPQQQAGELAGHPNGYNVPNFGYPHQMMYPGAPPVSPGMIDPSMMQQQQQQHNSNMPPPGNHMQHYQLGMPAGPSHHNQQHLQAQHQSGGDRRKSRSSGDARDKSYGDDSDMDSDGGGGDDATYSPSDTRRSSVVRNGSRASAIPGGLRDSLNDSSTPYARSPELRVSHKLAERKRRKEMKDLFDELRSHLPADRGMKASKWEILSKACDFIKGVKHENATLQNNNDILKRQVEAYQMGGVPTSAHASGSSVGGAPSSGPGSGAGGGGPYHAVYHSSGGYVSGQGQSPVSPHAGRH